jgi:hypothetical protein
MRNDVRHFAFALQTPARRRIAAIDDIQKIEYGSQMEHDVWDRVYTVSGYHDGPRSGVADLRGKPHTYNSQFSDELDEYTELFSLAEIDDDFLSLFLEAWAIWLRWDAAYRQGVATIESHPALPDDRIRHAELTFLIDERLKRISKATVIKRARFRGQIPNGLEVVWSDP